MTARGADEWLVILCPRVIGWFHLCAMALGHDPTSELRSSCHSQAGGDTRWSMWSTEGSRIRVWARGTTSARDEPDAEIPLTRFVRYARHLLDDRPEVRADLELAIRARGVALGATRKRVVDGQVLELAAQGQHAVERYADRAAARLYAPTPDSPVQLDLLDLIGA